MARATVAAAVVLALLGGLMALGGLSSLQANTPAEINDSVHPYAFVWFVWSLEVFTILFALVALVVDFNRLQAPLLALVSIVTVLVIDLINAHFYNTSQLPGSGGSATRGNVTIAGLIIVAVGNGFIIFCSATYNMLAAPITNQEAKHMAV